MLRFPDASLAMLLAATLLLSVTTHADAAVLCPALFAGGQPPVLLNPKLAARTHGLCFRARPGTSMGLPSISRLASASAACCRSSCLTSWLSEHG